MGAQAITVGSAEDQRQARRGTAVPVTSVITRCISQTGAGEMED